jgi:hypothetical protein
MTRTTDFRHLPPEYELNLDLTEDDDIEVEIPEAVERQAEFIRSIVKTATLGSSRKEETSAIRCRRRPKRSPCKGHFFVRLQDIPPEIYYRCTDCNDDGVITHWKGTKSDLTGVDRSDCSCRVIISEEGFKELQDIIFLDPAAYRIVVAARYTKKGVVLQGSYEDMDELVGYVAAGANHARNRRQEKILDSVFEIMNDAVGGGF